ncbi:MAG TPA: SRPBCC family protein [Gaiellaceae bacterium]|nr:SRPBCC family protein [Gaiellaceae bacterium]
MGAEYRFVDCWLVPGTAEEVYDVIGDALAYPRWWGDVFLETGGDPGPPRPGRRTTVLAKGFLPYRLRFASEVVEAERPQLIRMALSGDFQGGGTWTFEPADGGTRAVLDWRPAVEKPLVRWLTPLLRPLFRANHTWTMKRGQRHIADELQRRRACRTGPHAGGQ